MTQDITKKNVYVVEQKEYLISKFLKKLKCQHGFSIIEFMIVTFLIGLAVIMVFSYADDGKQKSRQQELSKGLYYIQMGVQQTFASRGNYTGLDNAYIIKKGILPDSFSNNGDTVINHPLNGEIIIEPINEGGKPTRFSIEVDNLEGVSCNDMALFGEKWDKVIVNNVTLDFLDDSLIADIADACKNDGESNTIVYESY